MPDWFLLWLGLTLLGLAGGLLLVHHRISALRVSLYKEGVDNSERHIEVIALADAMDRRVREHTHHLDYSPLLHNHPHDHPHQHEHVDHVHTLVKLSEHEDAGTKVVVKRCEDCGTVFRDRKVLVNGRTE